MVPTCMKAKIQMYGNDAAGPVPSLFILCLVIHIHCIALTPLI